jgi:hypothetical protein
MTTSDIRELRLLNQQLASPLFTNPADIVHYMGAVQSQDYTGAKWAIAQRMKGVTEKIFAGCWSSLRRE